MRLPVCARRLPSLALALGLGLLYLIGFSTAVRADSLAATFARGNRAFTQGDYAGAVAEYERLLESGVADPAVTFNLASAHGARGEYGQAIRYFERTLLLAPGDTDAKKALSETQNALAERNAQLTGEAIMSDRPPLSDALFSGLSSDTLAYGLLVSVWLASLLALALVFSRNRVPARSEGLRLGLGIACTAATLLASVSGFGLGTRFDWGHSQGKAIVIAQASTLREGPDPSSLPKSELPEGAPVRVLARDGAYVRIQSGPLEGYVLASEVGEI
jgi:hypothetical protein